MSEFWTAPKIWPEGSCFVVGGGPSLTSTDLSLLKGKRTIVTNNAYQLLPDSEVLFFMDEAWFQQHRRRLADYAGLKVTIVPKMKGRFGLKVMGRGSLTTLSSDPSILHHGNNSGSCAIQLAIHFGVRVIVLVGFDMMISKEGNHNFHNDHQRTMQEKIYSTNYIPALDSIVDPCKKRGILIVNSNMNSNLNCFPKIPLEYASQLVSKI